MKILIIGSGGREHALAWKLAQSPKVTKIYAAPGNPGMAQQAELVPLPVTDIDGLVAFAVDKQIDLTVVGPEAPLCAGITDAFQAKGLRVFGPTKQAAQLEGSKVFTKEFLLRHDIPTGRAEVFSDPNAARACVRQWGTPVVIKADGLAAGKGVIIARSVEEAETAIGDIMERKVFGAAGDLLIIEECLQGPEASVMALVDGKTYALLVPAQDHKRIGEGDTGLNTGGMGAYAPTPVVDPSVAPAIKDIFDRTLAGLRSEGIDYRGVLYAGLMLTENGPQVLEFNCRFGDPETQVVLPLLDSDLVEVCLACAKGRLGDLNLRWKPSTAVCVVLASGGYPGDYEKGRVITGLAEVTELPNVTVFHAGTQAGPLQQITTNGGRVLGVTGWDDGQRKALDRVYDAVGRIHFDGMQYRRDIAARVL